MPSNIEIKARATEWDHLRRQAEALSDTPCQTLSQEDVFFHVPRGRLKLRIFGPDKGELIAYQRDDTAEPKPSLYDIARTADPAGLRTVLAAALGVRGIVRKTRYLYLAGQTRIHLDEVEGLGRFVELEVVLRPDQSEEAGRQVAKDLMARLGIRDEDLLRGAYVDMLPCRE